MFTLLLMIVLITALAPSVLAFVLAVADVTPSVVDIAFHYIDLIVSIALPVILTWVGTRWLHINANSQLNQKINSIAMNAAAFGLSRVQAAANQSLTPEIKDSALAHAVEYANSAISPATRAKIDVGIGNLVEAKMQQIIQGTPATAVVVAPVIPAPEEPKP